MKSALSSNEPGAVSLSSRVPAPGVEWVPGLKRAKMPNVSRSWEAHVVVGMNTGGLLLVPLCQGTGDRGQKPRGSKGTGNLVLPAAFLQVQLVYSSKCPTFSQIPAKTSWVKKRTLVSTGKTVLLKMSPARFGSLAEICPSSQFGLQGWGLLSRACFS